MRIRFWGSIGAMATLPVVLFFTALIAAGQSDPSSADMPRLTNGKPDFSGVWARPRVGNITQDGKGCGSGVDGCTQKGSGPVSFTPLGAQLMKAPKFDYTA